MAARTRREQRPILASLTIRKLPADVKERLRRRASEHGQSMEAEARDILEAATKPNPAENPLSGAALIERLASLREAMETEGLDPTIRDRHVEA